MVRTKNDMEVAKTTVVSADCDIVYDSFVKQGSEIIDYCERFSGINSVTFKIVTKV